MSAPALPPPCTAGPLTLEEALLRRRSRREFSGEPLSPAELGQLLWAAHGVTGREGRRSTPTAGHTDAHEVYAATPNGVFRYDGAAHQLEETDGSDLREALRGAYDDDRILRAGAMIVLGAVTSRTAARYPERAERYVAMGLGHAAQNVLLQAEALGLWAYPIGAHDPAGVARLLSLPEGCEPLYMVAVGRPKA
ncbi:MAG: SagB/ThcOx family dehydrogenase [Actinobacteria bacterium]|nr:SagB/ThcOx family dehydrogenase [Actinomycetota bacterium]